MAVRPSLLSLRVLLAMVPMLACDSPSEPAPPPASAPAEARTTKPEAKVVSPAAVPVETLEALARPAGAATPGEPAGGVATPAAEPTPTVAEPTPKAAEPAPKAAEPAPAAGGDAARAKAAAPEAATASKAAEGRPAKAFTDCGGSETFAGGRCYASHEAACQALSCAGSCIETRSKPPQVVCG